MEKRYLLFFVLTFLVVSAYFQLRLLLFPPPPRNIGNPPFVAEQEQAVDGVQDGEREVTPERVDVVESADPPGSLPCVE